jgi:hypothetical protein
MHHRLIRGRRARGRRSVQADRSALGLVGGAWSCGECRTVGM